MIEHGSSSAAAVARVSRAPRDDLDHLCRPQVFLGRSPPSCTSSSSYSSPFSSSPTSNPLRASSSSSASSSRLP
eukprot:4312051-Pyramimonas_sp.AAC.1